MRLYLIAGEASGDLHGSNLVKALRRLAPSVEIRAWGGDLMAEAGAEVVKHYRELAFMGFWEVAKNLPTILRNLKFCKADILDFQPDTLVLIDYPGFNLRIARWAKQAGFRVVYYISPQLWAWHQSRVKAIRRDVDEMLVILPFEQDFYAKHGVAAKFVGHPLLDEFPQPNVQSANSQSTKIALLPGSRKQEVARILPPMLSVVRDFPEHQFVVAGAAGLPVEFFQKFLQGIDNVQFVHGQTRAVVESAHAALVKSGTSTLETALLGVPQVVCYAGNPISFAIAKRVVEVKFISLVNLILDKALVRELIQDELNRDNLRAALREILRPEVAAQIRAGYTELRQKLGGPGASERAARIILGNP